MEYLVVVQGPLKQMDGIAKNMLFFQMDIRKDDLSISKVMKILLLDLYDKNFRS